MSELTTLPNLLSVKKFAKLCPHWLLTPSPKRIKFAVGLPLHGLKQIINVSILVSSLPVLKMLKPCTSKQPQPIVEKDSLKSCLPYVQETALLYFQNVLLAVVPAYEKLKHLPCAG